MPAKSIQLFVGLFIFSEPLKTDTYSKIDTSTCPRPCSAVWRVGRLQGPGDPLCSKLWGLRDAARTTQGDGEQQQQREVRTSRAYTPDSRPGATSCSWRRHRCHPDHPDPCIALTQPPHGSDLNKWLLFCSTPQKESNWRLLNHSFKSNLITLLTTL